MPASAELDAADPLARVRERFLPTDAVAYLDGNSLGRPLARSAERIAATVAGPWAGGLIRSWDAGWLDLPVTLGDALGRAALGAAPGQTVVGDSTTVLLYKLARGALGLAGPERREIVATRTDFPTDRYVLEGIAEETGTEIRWLDGDPTPDSVAARLTDRTALVLLSHVGFRSGAVADAAAITTRAHDAGALVLWDLSHSAGVVPVALDAWDADLAVGCTYKYLNGGPGSPAFAYVAARHLPRFQQPIRGWLGGADPFEMAPVWQPADGIRRVLSGTPPILALQAVHDGIALVEEVGLAAIRTKSLALTTHAIELADALIPDATLATPRDPALRGGHITLEHPGFRGLLPALWERGVIPDFRPPDGLRLGLSPLSTSFAEVDRGIRAIAEELRRTDHARAGGYDA